MEYISVYKVKDEAEAICLQDLLKKEGIISNIKSRQIPMYDGIMKMAYGYWGELLVKKEDFEQAKDIIEGFLS
jgi:hypothetical protein